MGWSVGFLVLVCIAILLLRAFVEKTLAPPPKQLEFEKTPLLFSPAERSFYGVLEQAIGSEYRIMAKVRLGDVIQPKKGMEKSPYFTAMNKINKKHLDFVVCRKSDFVTVGAVELDDKSHQRQDRWERDNFVDQALGSAGVPIIHFSARMSYSVQDVRTNIANALMLSLASNKAETNAHNPKAETQALAAEDEFRLSSEEKSTQEQKGQGPEQKSKKAHEECPNCGEKMVIKRSLMGPHAGKYFWVCTQFSKCRSIKPVAAEVAEGWDF